MIKSVYDWNITKCRVKRTGNSGANYTFYIVDWGFPDDWMEYNHVIEMRNKRVIKTKYFHTKKEVNAFISQLTQRIVPKE